MRLYMLFAPAFLDWPVAIAQRIMEIEPGTKVGGFATGQLHTWEKLQRSNLPLNPIDRLDDLERVWLATPVDPQEYRHYEELLGIEALRRLVIADRQIGRGYVTGGRLPPTPLMRAARNPELLQRYVVGILSYFFAKLEDFRPDVVFCYTVAGSQAYALGLACQALSIPFAQFKHARIGKRMVIDDSILDEMKPIASCFEANLAEPGRKPELRAEAARYLKDFREMAVAPEYLAHHYKRMRERRSLIRLLRQTIGATRATLRGWRQPRDLRRPAPLVQLRYEIQAAVSAERLLRGKLFMRPGARPKGPFAFMPLHFDPEASTMVVSAMLTNQLSAAEAVSKSLPLGMTLMVKEHSPMIGWRPKGYYEQLSSLPGVRLASPIDSGALLARDAALTTVINGTSAMEALLFGKPAVVMGHPHFTMVGEGLVHCSNLEELPAAVQKALASPPVPDDRLISYLAAALEGSFECPIEVIWGKVSKQTVDDNSQVLSAIVDRLRALATRDPVSRATAHRAV
ncbi:MAG: hypothetical protein RH942_12095 [Kiloniellaceae bacterium]